MRTCGFYSPKTLPLPLISYSGLAAKTYRHKLLTERGFHGRRAPQGDQELDSAYTTISAADSFSPYSAREDFFGEPNRQRGK